MKRKKQTVLFVFLGLTFFSCIFIVGINYYLPHESTIGLLLITVSTNKVYYEIGEPIFIFLTITNPTIAMFDFRFTDSNTVDYDIIQNNQTVYQDSRSGWSIFIKVNIMPLSTVTQVITHTSTECFLKGGKYQITITLVGYCSRTTQIYVGIED